MHQNAPKRTTFLIFSPPLRQIDALIYFPFRLCKGLLAEAGRNPPMVMLHLQNFSAHRSRLRINQQTNANPYYTQTYGRLQQLFSKKLEKLLMRVSGSRGSENLKLKPRPPV